MVRSVWLVLAVCLLLAGCVRPRPLLAPDGVTVEPLRTISALEGKFLLRLAGVKGVGVARSVDLYRMTYPAAGPDGRAVRLSGLLALPRGAAPRRLVSFQHGTSTTRSAAPSRPDTTGLAAAVVFAGQGYALVAPDYPGLGASAGIHPYYVADETAASVSGMIAAAERLHGMPQAPVFLSGFSQGGHASLAALRQLEGQGRPVLGAALVAGAYDLRNVSLPAALKGGSPSDSLYLAYLARAYADRYHRPLESVLSPDAARTVRRVFAGGSPKEIMAALPRDPRQMFDPGFLDAVDHGKPHWFLNALAANSLVDVTPRAPVRLYYGAVDVDVVPQEAISAARAMRARGADVQAIDVGPIAHDASMLAAAPRIAAWLTELEASRPPPPPRSRSSLNWR